MPSILDAMEEEREKHPDLYDRVVNSLVVKNFPKGTILQRKGDVARYAYFVKRGFLRSYTIDAKGKVHIFMFAPEGWVVGDVESLVTDEPTELFIDCVEDSEVEILDREAMDDGRQLMPTDSQAKLIKRIAVLQRRIILLMSATALERYEHFITMYPNVTERIPQHMIASYLGITPEALSKVKGDSYRK